MTATKAQAMETMDARQDAVGARVRGACPSLAAPMATGDGLLVRLRPATPGLTLDQFRRLAAAAARHGNGLIEITARGNIQLRGLRHETLDALAAEIAEAGIAIDSGVTIETPALAGIDPEERADAPALSAALREAIAAMRPVPVLAPKLSIIVDGAGSLRLDEITADIRLTAEAGGSWRLAVAGTAKTARLSASALSPDAAIAAVLDLLRQLSQLGPRARGRDLVATASAEAEGSDPGRTTPTGVHRLGAAYALGLRLGFGQIDADNLIAFLAAAEKLGASEVRTAHDHALIVPGLDLAATTALEALAARHGLSSDADDPVNRIAVCAGAGGCASAFFRTRDAAAALIAEAPALLDGRHIVHLSGCAKGCAHPAPAALTLVGTPIGYGLVVNGSASAEPIAYIEGRDLKSALRGLSRLVRDEKDAGESVSACLTRLGANAIRAALAIA